MQTDRRDRATADAIEQRIVHTLDRLEMPVDADDESAARAAAWCETQTTIRLQHAERELREYLRERASELPRLRAEHPGPDHPHAWTWDVLIAEWQTPASEARLRAARDHWRALRDRAAACRVAVEYRHVEHRPACAGLAVTMRRTGTRARGAGRPRAAAGRSSSRSGDSGSDDSGPSTGSDDDPASAGRSPSLAPALRPTRRSRREIRAYAAAALIATGRVADAHDLAHRLGWTAEACRLAIADALVAGGAS